MARRAGGAEAGCDAVVSAWPPPRWRLKQWRGHLRLMSQGWRCWQEAGYSARTYLAGPGNEPHVTLSHTTLLAWERRRWLRRETRRCEGAATERREWRLTERGRAWAAT